MIEIKFLIKIPNKVKIKCPEVKFADSRIDRIQGRIITSISSIIIKFIKNTEEFNETKCNIVITYVMFSPKTRCREC